MKALVRRSLKGGDVGLLDLPEPHPEAGQIKIKVEYAGICGSDAKMFNQDIAPGARTKPPIVLGHEGVGIVVEVGEGVTNVKVGDRVAAETTVVACGVCRFCRENQVGMCDNRAGLGSGANGYMAEYVIANANYAHVIPPSVSAKAAAVLEPLGCAVKGVLEAGHTRPGDVAVVFGPGTIGLCVAQVAKVAGAYVVMVGTPHSRHRLEVAAQNGADKILISREQDIPKEVMALTDGYGADIVFECVGQPAVFAEAFRCVRKLGQLIVMATSGVEVPFDIRTFYSRQIRMAGSLSAAPSSWDIATRLLNQGKVNLEALVTDMFSLEDWQQGLAQAQKHEGIKVLLQP